MKCYRKKEDEEDIDSLFAKNKKIFKELRRMTLIVLDKER